MEFGGINMQIVLCDSCKKEIEKINVIQVYFSDFIKDTISKKYELCDACFEAMQREIPKLLNWRNRLR